MWRFVIEGRAANVGRTCDVMTNLPKWMGVLGSGGMDLGISGGRGLLLRGAECSSLWRASKVLNSKQYGLALKS